MVAWEVGMALTSSNRFGMFWRSGLSEIDLIFDRWDLVKGNESGWGENEFVQSRNRIYFSQISTFFGELVRILYTWVHAQHSYPTACRRPRTPNSPKTTDWRHHPSIRIFPHHQLQPWPHPHPTKSNQSWLDTLLNTVKLRSSIA